MQFDAQVSYGPAQPRTGRGCECLEQAVDGSDIGGSEHCSVSCSGRRQGGNGYPPKAGHVVSSIT